MTWSTSWARQDKHTAETNLDPAESEEINAINFLGLTEEIDDEHKEWVDLMSDKFCDSIFWQHLQL